VLNVWREVLMVRYRCFLKTAPKEVVSSQGVGSATRGVFTAAIRTLSELERMMRVVEIASLAMLY
jgi:hypothetical protein